MTITFRCVGCGHFAVPDPQISYEIHNRELGKSGWRIIQRYPERSFGDFGLHCPQCVERLAVS